MDVSDLSIKAPVVSTVVKTTGPAEKKSPATTGNSLPETRKVDAHPDDTQAKDSAKQTDDDKLNGLVDQANKALAKHDTSLKFTVAEGTDIRVIRIVDSDTGDVIRQIPSEQMVAIAEAIKEMKQGSVLADKA
jgi:flagellar protein FlaG